MTARRLWAGAGALAVLAVALALALRPGDEPAAAVHPAPSAVASSPALARLGDQQVGGEEFKTLLAQLPEQARSHLLVDRKALEAWIRSRLAEKALFQQAEAQGWLQRADIQAQVRAATEQIVLRDYLVSVSQVPDSYPSDADLQRAYEAGKAGVQVPARYRLSQIFLRVANPADDLVVRKQAEALAKQAQAANADFASLARAHSQDAGSAAQGGDIGLQPLAQLLPEVREVVPKLKVGAVSEPVQSAAGYHLLKLVEQQPMRAATLEEVAPRLRQVLRAQRQEQVAKAYVEGLFDTATLSIDGAALNQVLDNNR